MKSPNRGRLGNYSYDATVIPVRSIRTTTVACPTCDAPIGVRCSAKSAHRARHRLAVRKVNEIGTDTPDLLWLRRISPEDRRDLRKDAGFTTASALARALDANESAVRAWERGAQLPRGADGIAYVSWLKERLA